MTVRKPVDESFKAVHDTLLDIVALSLDSDKTLLPRSARSLPAYGAAGTEDKDTTATRSPPGATLDSKTDAQKSHYSPQVPGLDTLDLGLEQGADNLPEHGEFTDHHERADESLRASDHQAAQAEEEDDGRNPDDFIIMNETQAKRIVALCEMAFGVEISPDAVLADANVGLLARRVLGQKSLQPRDVKGTGEIKVG
jgi:phosphatidylethanolamine N-methyltransferase